MAESSGNTNQQSSLKLLIISMSLALVAVIAVNLYIIHVKREVEGASFTIYTLTRSVKPGTKLTQGDVKPVSIPSKYSETFLGSGGIGAIDPTELSSKLAKGESFQRAAEQNEFLTFKLFTQDEGIRFTELITPGSRLVFLPINSRLVPGSLTPGMYVDIEAPFATGGSIPTVLPIMERVQVKAVGTRTVVDNVDGNGRTRPTGSYQGISIEVSPDDATKLSEIERLIAGEFEVHLRNPIDNQLKKLKDSAGINPQVLDLVDKAKRSGSPVIGPGVAR